MFCTQHRQDAAQELKSGQEHRILYALRHWGRCLTYRLQSLAMGTSQGPSGGTTTSAWPIIIFAVVLVAAFAVSWIIGARSSLDIHSERPEHGYFKQSGNVSSWSYALAFIVGMGSLTIFAGKYGLGNTEISVLYNFVAPLIPGILYWFRGGGLYTAVEHYPWQVSG